LSQPSGTNAEAAPQSGRRQQPGSSNFATAHYNAYSVHIGERKPYSQIPKGLRGNEYNLKLMSNQ